VKIFEKLAKGILNMPNRIIIDFERGFINAISHCFPKTYISGCLFHYGQAIWRKIQNVSLSEKYKNCEKFRKYMRSFLDLAFVPSSQIHLEYLKLKTCTIEVDKFETQKLILFFEYFERNFVGYISSKSEELQKPLYNHGFWSVYTNIINSIPRTTCTIESWHRNLNSNCTRAHPNIAKFVELIQTEDEVVRTKLARERSGNIVFPGKNWCKEEKLRMIVHSYYEYDGFGYFEALYNIYGWKFE
jgi:hypothetical protein